MFNHTQTHTQKSEKKQSIKDNTMIYNGSVE